MTKIPLKSSWTIKNSNKTILRATTNAFKSSDGLTFLLNYSGTEAAVCFILRR